MASPKPIPKKPAILSPAKDLLLPAARPLPRASFRHVTRTAPALLLAALIAGCGSPGTPQPPSLKLPIPPTDLSAARSGNAVTLRWTMPRRAIDRVPLAGDQRVVICRATGARPCQPSGDLLLQPGLPASYTDQLPPDLSTGAPRLLTYTVLLENHSHHTAGPSNPAYSSAGAPPPAIESLRAQATPSGIVLAWQPAPAAAAAPVPATYLLRIERTRVFAPGESLTPSAQETRAGVPQPVEQILEVPEANGLTLDHATDSDAALNRTYRYQVQRLARLTLDGHPIEVSSAPGSTATIAARDLFPPAVPQGLEAVADSEGGAIDLSWTADADADLAGYRVYRRVAGTATPAQPISGVALLPNADWRDSSAQPGLRYAYSVSAVDNSGNESARSPEVEETEEPVETRPPAPQKSPAPGPRPPIRNRSQDQNGTGTPPRVLPGSRDRSFQHNLSSARGIMSARSLFSRQPGSNRPASPKPVAANDAMSLAEGSPHHNEGVSY